MLAEVLIISLIFILILYGSLYIRIIRTPQLTLKVTLGITSLRLPIQKKKLKPAKLFKVLGNTTAIWKASKYLLKKSSVRLVTEINEQSKDIKRAEIVAFNITRPMEAPITSSPLSKEAVIDNRKTDILVKSKLIFLFISLFIFLYYTLIRKIRRMV